LKNLELRLIFTCQSLFCKLPTNNVNNFCRRGPSIQHTQFLSWKPLLARVIGEEGTALLMTEDGLIRGTRLGLQGTPLIEAEPVPHTTEVTEKDGSVEDTEVVVEEVKGVVVVDYRESLLHFRQRQLERQSSCHKMSLSSRLRKNATNFIGR